MKFRKRYLLVPAFLFAFAYVFYSVYGEVKDRTIAEYNAQQMILAKEASRGIRGLFDHYFRELTYLSTLDPLFPLNEQTKMLMESLYKRNSDEIRAVTLVDASGRIVFTVPYHSKAVGADISGQSHVKEIMKTHEPVISELFMAVQGYKALAYHVPIFKNGIYKGSIAILIPFQNIAKKYLREINTGDNGFAWVISKKGVELYGPVPEKVGCEIPETYKNNPSVLSMTRKMMAGRKGTASWTCNMRGKGSTESVRELAAYYPIRLGRTLWSIALVTPENEVLGAMKGFTNRLMLIAALFLAIVFVYGYYVLKASAVLKEAKKRRRAEEALRKSEERYRSMFENTGTATVIIEEDRTISMANTGFEKLSGYRKREIEGKMKWTDFVVKEDLEMIEGYHDLRRKEMGDPPSEYEFRFRDRQGNTKYVFNQVARIPGTSKNVNSLLDITSLKKAQQALEESEKKYRLVVDHANDAIFIAQDERIKFANPKTEEMFGRTTEELQDIPFVRLIHPEDQEMVLERHKRRLKGEPVESIYAFRAVQKNGGILWAHINAVLIEWQGRAATINFLRDITPQKKMEAQLQQAQRMEAVGSLAGGIAHDFNNLLMGIQGNASLALVDTDPASPLYDTLKNIEEYVKKGAELTRQLLGFARGGKYEVRAINLNEILKKQNQLFGLTKKEITIRENYEEELWPVEADQGQMEQILLNLYVNASHAMPGGGALHVRTQNVVLDEDAVAPFQTKPGRYVKISVTDTGIGMDPKTKERIFDPFFTTKDMGQGTGLGLASVYGIVNHHGGFINVYSEVGKGTTFNIYLPASEKEVMEEIPSAKELVKGNETILLVDDEKMVLDVGTGMLKKLGYQVVTSQRGKEALEIYGQRRDEIDMVILDMIMPDMGGGEVFDRLKEMNPNLKVLLSSGYSINGRATGILERGCNGFIQKPFNLHELSKKIRTVLEAENGS